MVDEIKEKKKDVLPRKDEKATARINELANGSGWNKLGFFQRIKRLIRPPEEDDRSQYKHIAIMQKVINLLSSSLWPPLIRSKHVPLVGVGIGVDITKQHSALSWLQKKWDLAYHIWVDVQNKLKTEISALPLVEKEAIKEEAIEVPSAIGQKMDHLIESRITKVVSGVGIIGSSLALVPLMAPFLGGLVPATLATVGLGAAGASIGTFFDRKLRNLSTRTHPHIIKAWQDMLKYRRVSNEGAETLEATGKQEEMDEQYRLAEQDSKEIDTVTNAKRMKIGAKNLWASMGIIGGLLGLTIGMGILGKMPWPMLTASVSGIYLAANTFLGSLQNFFGARESERNLMVELINKYEKIRHKKAYDLICGNEELKGNENAIRISNVRFSFRDKKDPSKRNKKAVIDSDQTIVFGPGINVINGPSGCGKTTLYKLLKHWDDLDRGSIEYGMVKDGKFTGKPLTSLKAKSELPIGFSFQQLQGFSNFTVEEFWRLGSDKLDKKTIEAWAKKFQISIWADDKKTRYKQMSDLSGGELKRVGLVLSLMQGKPILVIDECTSGLNEVLAKKVLAEINELGKTHTIIFTTHNVDELRRLDVKRLVDIHKHPDGHSEMTLYEVLTKKQKEEYIASVHAQEPKVVEEDEVPIDELIRRSHAGPQEDKKHKNKHLENLGKTLHEGRVFDAYKVIRAIKADDELTWLRAIRERRIKEKIKKNIAASFKPGVRSALKRLTAEEGRRQRSKQKSKR